MVPRKESKFKEAPYQKIRKIHSCIWKLGQKLSKQSILGKKWPNFRFKWPKFRQIRIFQAYRVWFPQRRPQVQFSYQQDTVWLVPRKESKFKEVPYQKIRKIHSCVWKLWVKNSQLLGVKIASKMNSALSNYSVCRYSAKSNNI